MLATDLDGVFYSMRAEIPALLRTGGGSIVNMSSAIAVVGRARAAAYAASKHGVLGLTRTAAIEYGRDGIRVNTVGPGTTETPLTRDAIVSEGEKIVGRVPLGRVAVPEDIAPARRVPRVGRVGVLHRRLVRRRRRLDRTVTSPSARGGALDTGGDRLENWG